MTSAGGVLAFSVSLRDPSKGFGLVTFAKGSTPPAWARKMLGAHVWESEQEPAPEDEGDQEDAPPASEDADPADGADTAPDAEEDPAGELPEPPKRGAGSGRDAWVKYAESKGVVVNADMSRDEVIDAVELLGTN